MTESQKVSVGIANVEIARPIVHIFGSARDFDAVAARNSHTGGDGTPRLRRRCKRPNIDLWGWDRRRATCLARWSRCRVERSRSRNLRPRRHGIGTQVSRSRTFRSSERPRPVERAYSESWLVVPYVFGFPACRLPQVTTEPPARRVARTRRKAPPGSCPRPWGVAWRCGTPRAARDAVRPLAESLVKPPPVARANRRSASGSLDDVSHRLRLPSCPADRPRDLYGPLLRIIGIIPE